MRGNEHCSFETRELIKYLGSLLTHCQFDGLLQIAATKTARPVVAIARLRILQCLQ